MKLRTKLVLSAAAVIVAALAVTSVVIMSFVQRSTLNSVQKTAESDLSHFAAFFQIRNAEDPENKDLTVFDRTYGLYRFRQMEMHDEFTLRQDGEYLSNRFGVDPERITGYTGQYTEDEGTAIFWKNGDAHFVLASRGAHLNGILYSISLVRDVSDTFTRLRMLWLLCFGTAAAVAALAAVGMRALVVHALRPIDDLKNAAEELAAGEYRKRISVKGTGELVALADEFNRMAEAVEQRADELTERSERQQAFINDLSHELKTPITSILLNSETLLSRRVPESEQTRTLARIYEQGKWMERLSQKLMTLVLLQTEIDTAPHPLSELVEAAANLTEDSLRAQGIALLWEADDSAANMDFELMCSAVVNLVENARKASEAGTTVRLTAKNGVVSVRDEGRGIPASELSRITEPFYMVDRSRSKKKGGAGLGLALVKRIAEAHHASLSIESKVGEGTAVSIAFPMITN